MPVVTMPESRPQIEELVEREVRSRTSGRIRGLEVRVADGQVVIRGRTSTYYAKQLVSHAAMDTAEQLCVMNEVEVC